MTSDDQLLRRIDALEEEVQILKKENEHPSSTSVGATSSAGAFVQNAFNPDLSIITEMAVVGTSLKDDKAMALTIPGFLDESEREGKSRGISFNYFEMAFNIAVDPYFDFSGVVTVEDGGIDVEEAYVDSRQLPLGFQLRLGKFLSAFGRSLSMECTSISGRSMTRR
ncbi:MAG: hypothetical protein R3C68_07295 [Myxococcota bacterium]